MKMPNLSDVRIGAPDQKTTGAILSAPVGTTLPTLSSITKASVTLDPAFTGNEYISEDGLTLTPAVSTQDIKDWSGTVVRKILESFDGTLSWTMMSTNANALGVAFGHEHVTESAATSTHGKQVRAELGAHLPDERSFVFLMKDGDARIVIVVPRGQVTEVSEVTFTTTGAVGWGVTLSCYPDESGESIYIMTDDGVVTSTT